jgi:uncharacterized membrane protein
MARRKHRRGSPLYVTPAFDLFLKSYDLVKENFTVFALLYIFPLIIGLSNGTWVVASHRSWSNDTPVAANTLSTSTLPAYAWGGFGVALLFALAIAVALQVMLQAAQLESSHGRRPKISHLWQIVKKRGWQMFGLYLAVSFMVLLSFIPLLIFLAIGLTSLPILLAIIGVLIFIFPAVVMVRRYFVAPYVLLDDDSIGVWAAMDKSAKITLRDTGSVYSIMGVMILFSLFGALPLIGWIISFGLHFFYNVAPALRYQELKKLGS